VFDYGHQREPVGVGAVASLGRHAAPRHSAGAVTKTRAEELLAEIDRSHGDLARYQQAVNELWRVLAVLDVDLGHSYKAD
jgi:hypothetical protein